MANTTNTTTMTFEDAVVQVGTNLMSLYDTDADGNKVVLDEQASKAANETIDEVRKSAVQAFSPLFQRLQDHLAEQQARIEALQAQLLTASVAVPSAAAAAVPAPAKEKLTIVACPTIEWLKANHKGKGIAFKGYTVFCLIYQNVHDSFTTWVETAGTGA